MCPELGDRVRDQKNPNGGVSAARNHGMAAATGAYLALLDDDDEWRPAKIARQVELLTRRPEIGMVITDVERMDADRVGFEIFRRREFIPVDGWVLPHVLRNPALAPASAMLRREVFTATGGFDTTLRTAEDLDFHLRVAARFQIAVIAEPLTRAMRGHQGLSALARTNRDYLDAIERFVDTHAAQIAPADRAAALFWAYLRNHCYRFLGVCHHGVKLHANFFSDRELGVTAFAFTAQFFLQGKHRLRPRHTNQSTPPSLLPA